MEEHLNDIQEKEFTKTKTRHIEKLNKLIMRKKQNESKNKINEKWVCNMSKHALTEAERSRGLNYAVTPKKIPFEEFILTTQLACDMTQDQGQKVALRNEVACILTSAKLPPSNITRQEKEAIKTLSKNSNITTLPADKGRTTVILDTTQYEKQMKEMLMDHHTY